MATNDGYTKTISTAEFTETPRLVLEQATGDVHIEAWDNPSIEVQVSDGDEAFDVDVIGSQVTVRALPPGARSSQDKGKGDWGWHEAAPDLTGLGIDLDKVAARVQRSAARMQRNVERSVRRVGRGVDISINLGRWASGLDYRIKVPYNCHLSLRTSSGDLIIKGPTGTHLLQTTSGDVRMQNVGGNLLVTTASGDLMIQGIEGRLGIKTASGEIQVREAALQEVSLHTASGDVDLDLTRVPEREFEVKSISGDVHLALPYDAHLTVDASTLSGDIDCELPHSKERSGRARVLTINGGGTLARMGTVSGDIIIEARAGSRPARSAEEGQAHGDITRPESAGPSPRQQAELELLQAVERGEISPQEAMRRLAELGGR